MTDLVLLLAGYTVANAEPTQLGHRPNTTAKDKAVGLTMG
jgi:hypothetical protein